MHCKVVSYTGLKAGPRLIILGAVHGNERCGTKAILQVIHELDQQKLNLMCGEVSFVPITSPLAYARGTRFGDRNLNRHLSPKATPADFEDHLANWLCPLLAQHDVLLDLHSTQANNPPFAMLGPENNSGQLEPFTRATEERALAHRLGVNRLVDGWLSTYARGVLRRHSGEASYGYGIGTTEYMRSVGGYALTLECGQHENPQAVNVAIQAIYNALAFLGISDGASPPAIDSIERLQLYEVIDKQHEADRFSRQWASFDRLQPGDLIGMRHNGTPLIAEQDGYIVFPDAQALPQHEWFYLARRVS